MTLTQSLGVLRNRQFAWYFTARTVSRVGSAMVPVALAFAVLHLTGSALALGQVLAARIVATLVFLVAGGVVADRFDRTTVIQLCHAVTFLTQGMAAYLIISGHAQLWMIVVLESVNGAVTAFTTPAFVGVIPQLVERPDLQQANAVVAFSTAGLDVLGPAIAGLLVATIGAGWALAADAATYLFAIAALAPIRLPTRSWNSSSTMFTDIRQGWQEFRARTWVWLVVLVFGALNAMHMGAIGVIGPLLATRHPELGASGWGMVLGAEAFGVLAGTVVMMRTTMRFPLRSGLLAVAGAAPLILALAVHPQTGNLVVLAVLAGLGVQVFDVNWTTALQENIPEDKLSRVASYDAFGSFVAMPVGTMLFGLLAGSFDVQPVLVVSGILFAALPVLTLLSRSVRTLERVGYVAALRRGRHRQRRSYS